MSVEPLPEPPRAPGSESPPWPLALLAPATGTAGLVAALLGLVPPLLAVAIAAAVSAAVHGGLLVGLALDIHGRHHAFGPCRGVGFLSLGVLATGTGATGATAAGRHAAFAIDGLAVSVALFAAGLLMLPGAAPNLVARLRQALDGLGLAMCFLFTAWVLVIAPHGGTAGPFAVALGISAMLAIAVVVGLRAIRYRQAARACAAGAVLSTLGLAALAVVLTGTVPPPWLYLAGTALVYGPAVAYHTARRYAFTSPEPDGPTLVGTFAGYPVLAVPIAMVLAAALYHLVTERSFDALSAGLGCGVVAAITAREAFGVYDVRRYTRQVAFQEAHFRSLVAGSSDVTLVLDAELVVRWQSPAAARQLGLSDQDVLGRPFVALVHPDDVAGVRDRLATVLAGEPADDDDTLARERAALVEARVRDGFGHWRDTESTVSDQRSVPEVGALVVHLRDVGERRQLERTLHRMSFTDQLTGLANRRELMRTLDAMHAVPGQPGAVIVVDLDGFTAVNDVRGHEVGDAVLIEVARRLRAGVDRSDLPARLSGDEFAVATASPPVQAYALASRLLTMLTQPYELPGATVHMTACVGLAELAGAASSGDALSRAALALRRAREGRRGGIEWYDEALESALLHRMRLEQELPGVLGRGELDLVYQPVLDLVEGHPAGAEALLRWRHPVLGTVPAAELLPVAEDLGLVDGIGEWALHHACRQLSAWLRDGHDVWLSVQLADRQLAARELVTTVGTALDSHQVPADRLVLEVTEQGLSADVQRAVAQLAGLRALGVRTALTRFGTGATPLAHLRRLPVDLLKVDRSVFAEPARRTGPATPIIDVVVGLGRRLGLEIVAEGLEAEAHLDVVRAAGCRYGQGYLFGGPVPAEHFEAFLEAHRLAGR
jgi:diguanylate cyclase (GGDEF)-like protein/PAS domain S-box-containing protein